MKPQVVYFMRAGDFVKVGKTTNIRKRFADVQAYCPLPIIVMNTVNGGLQEERWIHQKFIADRVHGEWFRVTEELTTYIRNPWFPNLLELSRARALPHDIRKKAAARAEELHRAGTLKLQIAEWAAAMGMPAIRPLQ